MADDTVMEENAQGLFFDVAFTIIPSYQHTKECALLEALVSNGATYIPLLENDKVDDIRQHTHIISTHVDFPEYTKALDLNIHIVKPSWVLQSTRKGKQAQTRQHSPDPSQYFQDVVLTCATLPDGDKDAVIAGVMALGGQYSGQLTKLVTHIVTMDLEHDKCKVAIEKGVPCKILLPHWFDDCFRLGKKINEGPYMFPDPEILRPDNCSPVRIRSSPHVEGASIARPEHIPVTPPSSPSALRKQLSAFKGKKLYFSSDLKVAEKLMKVYIGLVEQAGGTFTRNVSDADTYIGQYRDGADYVFAARAGKEVANLGWFYNVTNRNTWTIPENKLLHYPVPREGIPGFKHMKISLSNYSGESRIYLESLVRHCGGEFTKTMKQDNTHLITAHKQSEKCEAAQEWNINIINHLWLEESYAKCSVQSLTNAKYTHFPLRTNLGEVVGQTALDMKRVEQIYYGKDVATVQQQQTARLASATSEPNPSPRKAVPASSTFPADSSLAEVENEASRIIAPPMAEDDELGPQTIKKPRGRPSKGAQTPSARLLSDEKENETPLSTGSRASKTAAMVMLHKQADDMNVFQKEMKRKGGVTHGGRRSSYAEDFSSPAPAPKKGRKRPSEEATFDADENATASEDDTTEIVRTTVHQAKRTKSAATSIDQPPVLYKMMVSGDERWLNDANKESKDRTILRQLGVQLTQNPQEVTLLCAPRILRTRKFVSALALAPSVVDIKYLDYALKQNKLPETSKHPLLDRDSEDRLGFTLTDSIARAKNNDGKLLRGWSIFVTKEVNGGFDTYKEIVTLNGGAALMYQGRTGVSIPKRRLLHSEDPDAGAESQNQGGDEEFDYVYLISGSKGEEVKHWKKFRDLAGKQGLEARIVKTDWLLSAAMSQQVEWDERWALDEENVAGCSQRQG